VKIIGIDPGTLVVGYGVVEQNGTQLTPVTYGVVDVHKIKKFPERLAGIYEGLRKVIEIHQPETAAVEEVFYGKSPRSAIRIGEGRAVAILALVLAGIPVAEYEPTRVKKAVVGNGHAHKTQVQTMVKAILGLQSAPEPLDASDALAIAICHCHNF